MHDLLGLANWLKPFSKLSKMDDLIEHGSLGLETWGHRPVNLGSPEIKYKKVK